jgi:hypothetical protein
VAITEPTTDIADSCRWFHPTAGKLLVALLAVEVGLLLSKPWFPKGWAVLISIAGVAVMMVLMFLWFALAFLFRWRFQFSIRSLMVLTVAVAIPFSWLAVEMKQARRQRAVVEAIYRGGMSSVYDYQNAYWMATRNPLWLRYSLGEDYFQDVVIECTFTEMLDFPYRQLSWEETYPQPPPGSSEVATHEFDDLDIKNCVVLHRLKKLSIAGSKITDEGLVYLQRLPEVESLDLSYSRITDNGLKRLGELKQLQSLNLANAQVTDAGVAELQKALPNCKIER